ncbi:MAG TPA: helix-turn-helix domain-containing protein [Streptosporangiaceae bacterium]|nr:helix-turn-helix domain-containing protein [Streptosporangiaceae bacterium]
MSEQDRSPAARSYRMGKRAEDVAATRRRIVEAAVHLHGTVGPAATTVSALADQAGVTRLTVYRHFPDDLALFAACSAHWASGQVMPDPQAWRRIADPEQRLRAGLSDLYRFYRAAEPMLTNVRRDRAAVPSELRERTDATDASYRDILLQAFAVRGPRRRRLRAVLGHAVSFWTWRSLCLDQHLSDPEAVNAMATLALATAEGTSSRRTRRPGPMT